MKAPYLEVTYRHGRSLAAYLYLTRPAGEKSWRTARSESGLLVDFDRSGKAIGIEITVPAALTAAALDKVLCDLDLPALDPDELRPLEAA